MAGVTRLGARHSPQLTGGLVGVAVLASAAVAGAGAANAYDHGLPLNGTYAVVSNGDWAQSNDVYHDEVTIRQVWTITSSCENPQSCSGWVASDMGWNADLSWKNMWLIRRDVPNWQRCPDGTSYPGVQIFRFSPVNDQGQVEIGSSTLAGQDVTTGASGACSVGQPLVITLPLRVQQV